MKRMHIVGLAILLIGLAIPVYGASDGAACEFSMDAETQTMTLLGDCVTTETVFVPDGWTLDGAGFAIVAVDPDGDHFRGAVVQNQGAEAHVVDLRVEAQDLANACDAGADRLRGIMFDGASGSIVGNAVHNINQGLSGCQEGNGIEVRNAPFDGTHPNTVTVKVSHNTVTRYQKTGIVANGDVSVEITNNFVGSAELPEHIAANSVQVGFGAFGSVNHNEIVGNQWDVVSTPQWVATAVLVFLAGDVSVSANHIRGEATDAGVVAVFSGDVNVMNNVIERTPPGDDDTVDEHGVGAWFFGNAEPGKVVRNSFDGWNENFRGADVAQANESDA